MKNAITNEFIQKYREFTIEQIREFVKKGFNSVSARVAKSALEYYDEAINDKTKIGTGKTCKLINGRFSWIMEVDDNQIGFNGGSNADYFAQHYAQLGYLIEWDREAYKRDE